MIDRKFLTPTLVAIGAGVFFSIIILLSMESKTFVAVLNDSIIATVLIAGLPILMGYVVIIKSELSGPKDWLILWFWYIFGAGIGFWASLIGGIILLFGIFPQDLLNSDELFILTIFPLGLSFFLITGSYDIVLSHHYDAT